MDPKKKRIYIAIIVICILASGFILYKGGVIGGSSADSEVLVENPVVVNPNTSANTISVNQYGKKSYPTPSVFPSNPKFDFSVLDSLEAFKQLKVYSAIINDPSLLGREDPFKTY